MQKLLNKFPGLATLGSHNSAMITDRRKFTAKLTIYGMPPPETSPHTEHRQTFRSLATFHRRHAHAGKARPLFPRSAEMHIHREP